MARLFDDGSTEYLQIESAVVSAYPIGMGCLFNSNDDAVNQVLMFVGDGGDADRFINLRIAGNIAGDFLEAIARQDASAVKAITSAGYTANTWHHAAGIWLAANERHAYLDRGNKGSNTDVISAMANFDRTAIGAARDSSPGAYMSGHIAEAAIWDLTDWGGNDAAREVAFELAIASMAKGYSPLHFPLGLLGYWLLVRGLNDRVGGFNMTASGTVVSAHPRVIYPSKIWVPHISAAVGGSVPVIMQQMNQFNGGMAA